MAGRNWGSNPPPPRKFNKNAPEKLPLNPIGKEKVFQPRFFRGELLNFRGACMICLIYMHGIDEFLCMMLMETTAQIEMDNVTVLKTNQAGSWLKKDSVLGYGIISRLQLVCRGTTGWRSCLWIHPALKKNNFAWILWISIPLFKGTWFQSIRVLPYHHT